MGRTKTSDLQYSLPYALKLNPCINITTYEVKSENRTKKCVNLMGVKVVIGRYKNAQNINMLYVLWGMMVIT